MGAKQKSNCHVWLWVKSFQLLKTVVARSFLDLICDKKIKKVHRAKLENNVEKIFFETKIAFLQQAMISLQGMTDEG